MDRKINKTELKELVQFFVQFARKNNIKVPELEIMSDIAKDTQLMHGHQTFSHMEYAFRNWQTGNFPRIRKPTQISGIFIGEVLREFQNYKGSGARGEGTEMPKPKTYDSKDWTIDELHSSACKCLESAHDDFIRAIRGTERVSMLKRRLWAGWTVLRDYGLDGHLIPSDEWKAVVRSKDINGTGKGILGQIAEVRDKRGAAVDHSVLDGAAKFCAWADSVKTLPMLRISDRKG